MKLGVFIDSVNVEDLKKVKGFVGMIGGSCDCKHDTGEEKNKILLEKMEDLKVLCKERYADKKKLEFSVDGIEKAQYLKKKKLEQVFKEADSLITDKKAVIDAIKGMSNKPSWNEAPESAQILAYSPAFGWMFGSYKDAKPNALGITWIGERHGCWFKPKYARMDETVIDWRNTLEKRPAKKLSVEEAAKRIQKIIQKPKPKVKEEKVLDPKLKKFYDRLKSFDPVTRSIIKEKTSKAFGLMPAKYKLVSELIKAGKMKELEDGKWKMM